MLCVLFQLDGGLFDFGHGEFKGFTPVCVTVQTMFLNDFDLEFRFLRGSPLNAQAKGRYI